MKPHSGHQGKHSVRIVVLIGLAMHFHGSLPGTRAQDIASADSFARPDITTIRAQTRSLLSDPTLAPRKSAWQWLMEELSRFDTPDFHLPSWLGEGLMLLLLTWCLLTLLAIAVHMVWTLVILLRSKGGGFGGKWRKHLPAAPGRPDFEEIRRHMEESAAAGRYRESLALMILALVCLLDRKGILRYRESKTNGEYLREYPSERGGRTDFRLFVLAAENYVYGGEACPRHTYRELYSLFDRLQRNVQQNA